MQHILVTGGAGYIGSILVPELLRRGAAVTVIDNFMYKQASLLHSCSSPDFRVIRGDVRDRTLMAREVPAHDVIVPLAAIVGAPACERQPEVATAVNLESIRELAGLVSSGQRILFPVTNSGYGIGESDKYCTEESPLNPVSLYGRDKVAAERVLLETGVAATFRLATVFGTSPRMRLDLLVNDFVYRAVYDRFIVLFESHFKRNYIHVRDVTGVFLFALENWQMTEGQTFNVGLSDANLSKRELCEHIQAIVPDFHVFESEIGKDPDKRDYVVSNDKIESLGWRPQHDLDDGIRELVKGYTMIRNAGSFDNL